LTPAPPRPTQRRKEEVHVATRTGLRRLRIPLALVSLLAIALGSLPLMILGAVVWAFWALYYILVTRILLPTGEDTPSVNQHSSIEAMEVRGRYEEAADAYRAVIAADPGDIVACEKLGQLALRQLKQHDLALFAYREAERRSTQPRRQLGYALIIAGIYRDSLKDHGKAVVELRRILERYPDAPNADRLRAELDELKAAHFEAP
jgi:tetratricopeptide (TPR) repeat protein